MTAGYVKIIFFVSLMLRKTIQDVCAKVKIMDPFKVQLRYNLTSTILTIKVIQQRMFFE